VKRNGHTIILAFAFALLACSKDGGDTAALEPVTPSPEIRAQYDAAVDRVLDDRFTAGGFVVSRVNDGSVEHTGDSLIWTGMLFGSLPCDRAPKIGEGLRAMITELDGGLYRHPTLPDEISQDGALGLYWGVAHHITRCPDQVPVWAATLAPHKALGNFELNRNSTAQIFPEFTYARDRLFAAVGIGEAPDSRRLATLAAEGTAAALDAKLRKRACFRVHLALLAMETAERLGDQVPGEARNRFCQAIDGMGMTTADHFCGRRGLAEWAAAFQPNVWEFAHQRCPGWESPDGRENLETPGVDLLVALTKAHGL
jgi:hypothetical protein